MTNHKPALQVTALQSHFSTISEVFTQCPHKQGYDLMIGTSEKGEDAGTVQLKQFQHLLIVIGGVGGLEAAIKTDKELDISDPKEMFDLYLNICPNQGSRTIRSEEALLITLSSIRPKIVDAYSK